MLLRLDRRLIAVASAVLMMLSVVAHAVMMAEVAGQAAAAPMDVAVHNPMSARGDCSGMGGDAARTNCEIQCGNVVGIVSSPVDLPIRATTETARPHVVQALRDRPQPPDPRPPKPTIVI